jgi:hypothetical protein
MGIAGSPDIFQVEMSELMINLEPVCNYLDDLLIITKLNLSNHLDKLKGIQVNNIIIQKNKLDYENNLVEKLHVLCKDRQFIPKRLQE